MNVCVRVGNKRYIVMNECMSAVARVIVSVGLLAHLMKHGESLSEAEWRRMRRIRLVILISLLFLPYFKKEKKLLASKLALEILVLVILRAMACRGNGFDVTWWSNCGFCYLSRW
ncbi:hypothetical protein, unlikely [Trypanosoma brucei gambiense DAL972]|uniref:Uncharacterized protein n=1 Tax=Trypanosoma brucei gambiense (strain MHOM/CI/86/DAL972) TaxID=679716 RepID=C9ZT06_TRYB9|nr:hypothetical protein, unlikely [Trypanosoma brucei gambiense DAL972]CBH12541.1 hypothetical protein, unlikely [Trypanosoma brucei gambiense DAL972]|eukprot:XP_011774821.1 hypothetical protein, unlikely [Trypanosoma brucei gambiense DAL972]